MGKPNRLGAAALLVIVFIAGCGAGQSKMEDDLSSTPAAQVVPTATATQTPTKEPELTASEKEEVFVALFDCQWATPETVGLWFERRSVIDTMGLDVWLREEVEEVSLGWEFAPTDEVVGGGWSVSYRWLLDNGVTEPSEFEARFLHNPKTGKTVAADAWAQLLLDQVECTDPRIIRQQLDDISTRTSRILPP